MKRIQRFCILFTFIVFSFQNISCASYRVVKLAKGTDAEGHIHDYYAVAENNVVIPEYVINEKGEYPESLSTAKSEFNRRKSSLVARMHQKYVIPGNTVYALKSGTFALMYTILFPITFPVYYFIGEAEGKSIPDYYNVMIHGEPREPKLRNELENF